MNSPGASTLSMGSAETRSEHSTQLSGAWLILARGICVALFGFSLTVFFADLPGYFAQLQTVCEDSACAFWQPTPTGVLALQGAGLTIESYAIFRVAFSVFCVLVWSAAGATPQASRGKAPHMSSNLRPHSVLALPPGLCRPWW